MQALLYTRVSTQEQAKERNGLEGQLASMQAFCESHHITPLMHLQEVASGGVGIEGRHVLSLAFRLARKHGACVLVSKLDRLSREVELISSLMNERVPFFTVEDGLKVEPFMLHLKAAFAEKERIMIGERTKLALQAKKARGEALGRALHKDPAATQALAIQRATAANRATAKAFADQVAPVVQGLVRGGLTYAQAAERLNASGTPTARGGLWHASTVCNVLKRAGM